MLLTGKNAVVYGAGAIGGAAARAFAREGATVHLASRSQEGLDRVAGPIRDAGGTVWTTELDALDQAAVDAHADAVAADAGSLDISMNVILHGDVQGTPLVEMTFDDFVAPVVNGLRTTFLTSRAAARHMIRQGSGVLLFFGGYGDPVRDQHLGGLQVGLQAIDTLRSQLAAELGRFGIRTVTLQTGGITDSIPADMDGYEHVVDTIVGGTLLGRAADLDDVGNVAAFAASDWARTLTATKINLTCGAEVD